MNTEATGTTSMQDEHSQPDEAAAWNDEEPAAVRNPTPATGSTADTESAAQTGATPDTEPAAQTESTRDMEPPTETDSTPNGPAAGSVQSSEAGSVEDADVTENGHSLLPADARQDFSSRWNEIQANFVDRPQGSVQDADVLVVEVMQRVTGSLSKERERLESQWRQGDDVSTEDLRVALTRYRSFFDRLLSA